MTLDDDPLIQLLADWVEDKNNSPAALATSLGYSSSNTIHQWLKRGRVPRHQAERVREEIAGQRTEVNAPTGREPTINGAKVKVTLTTDQGQEFNTSCQGPVSKSNFLALAERFLEEPYQETKSEGGVYSVIRHQIVKVVLSNE